MKEEEIDHLHVKEKEKNIKKLKKKMIIKKRKEMK